MEFFIPGLSIFLLAIVCTALLAPKATPMVAAILSIVFLTYGVYDHYKMFQSEYRLSTWQQTFQIYLPYIMITAIILYAIFGMITFFTGGAVPIPLPPVMELPTVENAGKGLANTFNTAVNTFTNTASNFVENTINTGNGLLQNVTTNISNNLGLNQNKQNGNLSRSMLETI
jgi:hypothetical protein